MEPPPPAPSQQDLLLGGPPRPAWHERVPPPWRRRAATLGALALLVLPGAGVVSAWILPADPSREGGGPGSVRAAGAGGVRLVLSDAVPAGDPGRRGVDRSAALRIDGALLHQRGSGAVRVTGIEVGDGSLRVRTRALPVRLSRTRPFHPVRLWLGPPDCAARAVWSPDPRPLLLSWTDGRGMEHEAPAGDHDDLTRQTLLRHRESGCAATR